MSTCDALQRLCSRCLDGPDWPGERTLRRDTTGQGRPVWIVGDPPSAVAYMVASVPPGTRDGIFESFSNGRLRVLTAEGDIEELDSR